MIDWTILKPRLQAIAAKLTGIPIRMVTFDGAAMPMIDPVVGAIVELMVWPAAAVGEPDILWKDGDPVEPFEIGEPWGGEMSSPLLVESVESVREINLRIKVTCFVHTPGVEAETITERIAGRIYSLSTRKLLEAAGLGFSRLESTQYPTTKHDQRIRSVGVQDVKLYIVNVETDGPYDVLETAETEQEITA